MHDKPAASIPGAPADPAAHAPMRRPASHLRLVVAGEPVAASAAMRLLAASELRRVTGGPAAHPTPCLPPAGKPR